MTSKSVAVAIMTALALLTPTARATPYRLGYDVRPLIVGVIDTGTNPAIYNTPRGAGYDGVVQLVISRTDGTYGCSGALIAGGWTVLTAGHCVTNGFGQVNTTGVQATFLPSSSGSITYNSATIPMTAFANPGWTGAILDGNDLALINMSQAAPAGTQSYGLYMSTNEIGQTYNVAGFGETGQGSTGSVAGTFGSRHRGNNIWNGTLFDIGIGTSSNILLSDFDDGSAAHDGWGYYFGVHNLGLGDNEVSTAPGDSGGPSFINGYIAGITSFGLRLSDKPGGGNSDIDGVVNSSFGEFSGMTRVSSFSDWILATEVPEPGSLVLTALGLLALACRRFRRQHGSAARAYTRK